MILRYTGEARHLVVTVSIYVSQPFFNKLPLFMVVW